ncbi:MAG: hypothetical protein H6513_06450 [Acidimicrobiaceae bacterium]|nr:hypothetical protein [Acidimicrobiaceae bacterium]MCO5329300.1 hypothetical protein [Ilumatobacteraceae bacterium]
MSSPIIIACLKWVAHPGEPHDERFAGASPADRAALELALQQAKELGGTVTAVTVGPPATETVLRDAVAAGADRAVRVDGPAAMLSSDVAAGIAGVAEGAAWVWCGDYSLDRGTGSVPAFLAAALGAQQALGVIDVQFAAPGPAARVTRRLDGGRREVLDVTGPAVVSVEGAVADLRRAGLGALRVATSASIDVVPLRSPARRLKAVVQPYRPRAMALAAPDGSPLERLRLLTDAAAATAARGETVTLAPPDAAARIVAALRGWGYLDS